MSDFAITAISGSLAATGGRPNNETPVARERQNNAEEGKVLPPVTAKQAPPVEAKVAENNFSTLLENKSTELQFQVSEISKRTLITVRDTTSGDIIRQIPSKAVIAIATYLAETTQEVAREPIIDDFR